MPAEPRDPSRPSRLIVPGSEEAESPPEPQRRIVVPGEPETEAPRIVLPPGAMRETAEDLPEYPRLRPLALIPFTDGQRQYLIVNDPMGVIPGQPVLGAESLAILQLLDGTVSINDIAAAVMRESKDLRVANMIRDFVAQLDELLMLDSPRFQRALQGLRDAYHPLEIRPAAHEGRSYPADRDELARVLDGHFAAAETLRAKDGAAPATAPPRALMAPHLELSRAGPAIARAFLEIPADLPGPLRVVVFGTGHQLLEDHLALTRKHFETPLGKMTTDTAFVDALAERLGEAAYRSELAHRDEHSIEFQVLYLMRRFADRPVTLVPILCGGFHHLLDERRTPRDDAAFESLIDAVREAERRLGGTTVHVAGVDLSHVGPRFGDPRPDERMREDIEAKDRSALEAARRGDADGWFQSIAAHDDSTRICGFGPTYALLRCAGKDDGTTLHYEQSIEPDGTLVSFATLVWR